MTAVFFFKFQVIGDNQVAVPTHFFKVLVGELDNQQLEMEAYVLPNEPIPDNVALTTFQVIIFQFSFINFFLGFFVSFFRYLLMQ